MRCRNEHLVDIQVVAVSICTHVCVDILSLLSDGCLGPDLLLLLSVRSNRKASCGGCTAHTPSRALAAF